MKSTLQAISLALLSIVMSGCATVDYSELVSRLDQAINDSADTIESIDADLTARKNAVQKGYIVDGDLLLNPATGQCAIGTGQCTLVVVSRQGTNTPYPLKSSMPNGLFALQSVKTYVGKLKSISEADTAAKVVASANSTLRSLEVISKQLDKVRGESGKKNTVTDYKKPVTGFIEFLSTRYVKHIKTKALANATKTAHPIIEELTGFYETAARSWVLIELAESHGNFVNKQGVFDRKSITTRTVDAYVRAAADYDVALKVTAAKAFSAFNIAHEKLMKQLNGEGEDKVTLEQVAAAIESLEEEAKAIKAAVDVFTKEPKQD